MSKRLLSLIFAAAFIAVTALNPVTGWAAGGTQLNGRKLPPPVLTLPCAEKPPVPGISIFATRVISAKSRVKLEWDHTPCTARYKVTVRQNKPGGIIADKATVLTSNYKTVPLTRGHTYFWRITACNIAGCSKSGWYSFELLP